jgi:peroxin-7
VPASGTELLSLDWNKYRPFTLASAGVDRATRVWDCRMAMQAVPVPGAGEQRVGGACEATLVGHEYAVRKVQWSPHRPEWLATASYDMTCRVWSMAPAPQVVHVQDAHSEFVVGCGWALYQEGVLASCGWDGRVNVYRV